MINPYFQNLAESVRREALRLLDETDQLQNTPVDLLEICEMLDIPVEFKELSNPRRLATTLHGPDFSKVIVNTDQSDNKNGFSSSDSLRRRQRFSMAHELAHVWLSTHVDKKLQAKLTTEENPHSGRYRRMRENQANEFASELLMPQPLLEEHIERYSWDKFFQEMESITDLFDVSLVAACMRMSKEAPFPATCIFFNKAARSVQWPAVSRDWKDLGFDRFPPKGLIPKGTIADDLANTEESVRWKLRSNDCSLWFPDEKNADRHSLIEQATRVGQYGYLVFLSFEEKEVEY